jgi:diguanylate cyclase (GGDEF)-like protein/PAS domain S-box-containing protein
VKNEQKIILFSILAGLATWFIDALVDTFIFSRGPFWSVILTGDTHEFYMRSLFLLNFVLFGVLTAGFMRRRQRLENARITAEKALHESEGRLRSVVESTADSIYLLDAEYRYLFMNRKHVERLGLTDKGYIGCSCRDFCSSEEVEELAESVNWVFKTGDTIQNEHFSRRDQRYFLRTFSPVKDAEARTVAVTVVSKDINEFKQMEEKLRNLALTDELTGLYNRRGFFMMVDAQLRLSKRQQKPAFLLYTDLDNLKEINDTLGHHEGDQALIDTANVFRATFRATDIVARIGGDEFVIIPVADKKEDADLVIARFKGQITAHNMENNRAYKLSISVGMACYDPADPHSIDDLLKQAEKRMYEEKALKQKPVDEYALAAASGRPNDS